MKKEQREIVPPSGLGGGGQQNYGHSHGRRPVNVDMLGVMRVPAFITAGGNNIYCTAVS